MRLVGLRVGLRRHGNCLHVQKWAKPPHRNVEVVAAHPCGGEKVGLQSECKRTNKVSGAVGSCVLIEGCVQKAKSLLE